MPYSCLDKIITIEMNQEQTADDLAFIVSKSLRQIEETLSIDERVHIYVPAGVIRTVRKLQPEYSFVSDSTLRRNICYGIEALDFYRWLINRFGIYGPVAGYLYKTGIILIDSIVESITRDFLSQMNKTPCKKHSGNINKLETCGVPSPLCARIIALHGRRSNIHLHLVTDLEASKYDLKDWNRSIKCLHSIKEIFPHILENDK